ncbi:MAG: hypothetical protein FWF54_01595 [Candidatus Azobacteroides sp.]|nr:hypothetical protein [Candidatus Azobacteroides sp.]
MTVAVIILVLLIYPLFVVIKYGKGIFRPNFARVDRILSEKSGLSLHGAFSWNTVFGKAIYYFLLFISIILLLSIITGSAF